MIQQAADIEAAPVLRLMDAASSAIRRGANPLVVACDVGTCLYINNGLDRSVDAIATRCELLARVFDERPWIHGKPRAQVPL